MKKRTILTLVSASVIALLFAGCSGSPVTSELTYTGDKGGEPVEMSKIVDFSFSYSSGSYMNSGSTYRAKKTDDGVDVVVRQDGIDEDDVPHIITDEAFLTEIEKILTDNHAEKWNGYSLSAKDVLDGDSFSLHATMDNGQSIDAHGYEAWPDGYGSVCGALDELFVTLYESKYPNPQKALEAYFTKELLGGVPYEQETVIEYPYIRSGENQFEYGDPKQNGIISGLIGDFTGADRYSKDPRELLVVRLRPEDADTEGFVRTVMTLELYRIDDEMNISQLAETVIDEDVCSNEGLYGSLFTHEYNGRCLFGYSVLYNNRASVDDDTYLLRLFALEDGTFERIADEKMAAPANRDSFTIDQLSAFTKVAEEYEFGASLAKWTEKPWDPMVDRNDRIYTIAEFSTKNNYDKGFDDAFEHAPIGDAIGNYAVSGTFKGAVWRN